MFCSEDNEEKNKSERQSRLNKCPSTSMNKYLSCLDTISSSLVRKKVGTEWDTVEVEQLLAKSKIKKLLFRFY